MQNGAQQVTSGNESNYRVDVNGDRIVDKTDAMAVVDFIQAQTTMVELNEATGVLSISGSSASEKVRVFNHGSNTIRVSVTDRTGRTDTDFREFGRPRNCLRRR